MSGVEFVCECPLRGFCYKHMLDKGQREHDICRGVNVEPHVRQKYLTAWGAPPPVFVPPKVGIARDGIVAAPMPVGGVGTELTALIGWFKTPGCSCVQHAKTMDQAGIAWCEANVETIVGWMAEGAAKIGLMGFTLDKVPGFAFGAAKLVEKAIANAKRSIAVNPHRRVPRPDDPPIMNEARFTREPTRHMIYHIWPTAHSDAWQWNVAELRKRIEMFNGLRIVGIAIDAGTVSAETVKAAFDGVRIDHWIIVPNDARLGEGATFLKMMELLPRDINSITWYGHAKGAKYKQGTSGVVPRWTSIMYRSTLDHYTEVRNSLQQFPITGSLKRYGDFNKPNTWRWHYSGTFFWFRNADVFTRQWQRLVQFYGAVECWPSCVFQAAEGGVLIGNDAGLMYVESEVEKRETELLTWPADMRSAANGVSDRWFFEEEYRRQIDTGNWPALVATHTDGAIAVKSLGAKSVVEIGSGLGAFLIGAKNIGLDAIGFGCSQFERDFAITQGVEPERYAIATASEYQMQAVDAAYCIEVLEHIPDAEIEPLLKQIAKRCRWFYFSSTPNTADNDAQWGHINIKSQAAWIGMFAKFGIQFVRADASVVPWGMVFASSVGLASTP